MAGPLQISLRSEAEAPWRSLRLVLFGFFAVSASVATVIALTQLIGAANNRGPQSVTEVLQGLGIDIGAVALFAFLVRRDLAARDKQMARMLREEKLGALQLELANRKVLKMAQLRSFSRAVLFAGTPEQCRSTVEVAEQYRDKLEERGVLLVPLPIYAADGGGDGADAEVPALAADDLRWRAKPLRLNAWADWFEEQLAMSNAKSERGLYISLRMDGRVRGSGMGPPPFERMVAQLPPTSGLWQGLLDGMDGRV